MHGFSSSVLSCLERERLEEDLSEARIRGRNLSRMRASERSSSSLSRSRQLRTLLEKPCMVHLLKTARPNYHYGEQKANIIYSPYVRLFRPACLRRRSQLANIAPNHFKSLFTAEVSFYFRRELRVEVRTPNANLLEFFILKWKGGKSVK